MVSHDLLVEIGTEELPAKNLSTFSNAFAENIKKALIKAELLHGEIKNFVTPRRLAVLVKDLTSEQKSRTIERKGPAIMAAFDQQGKPTPASLGFARSCGVSVEQLQRQQTPQGEFLFFTLQQPALKTAKLLPDIIQQAIATLPFTRTMRWGAHPTKFIRPVHNVLLLFGEELIDAHILGVTTKVVVQGHHFMHPATIAIKNPQDYSEKLFNPGKVIADFDERKALILQQINNLSENLGTVVIDNDLLMEVTGLVEWPVALLGCFEKRFLKIPPEVLISSMKNHQKCFSVIDKKNNLLPYFITISNIESKNPDRVIKGNERVIRARLSDAEFFYQADLKNSLQSSLEKLKTVVFQTKLGSIYEKAKRVAALSAVIASQIDSPKQLAERAGLLAKSDLLSEMVGEFPELQGVIGYYYAINDGEPQEVALAIKEHYLPRFAGDDLPTTSTGAAVAIADRMDTLVGIFGINQAPTGEKDPFGLRRAAISILRIIIEKKLPLDLKKLLQLSINNYQFQQSDILTKSFDFIMERLRSWYADQGISSDVFAAVISCNPTEPLDFHHHVTAVQHFCSLPEAKALAAANKRVSNILKKEKIDYLPSKIDEKLLMQKEEKVLAELLMQKSTDIEKLCRKTEYAQALSSLATLQKPIDAFFDSVMVMTEDEKLKQNRLALLMKLRDLFLQIADVSLLQL